MRICRNCGAALGDGERFCSSCGTKVEENTFNGQYQGQNSGYGQYNPQQNAPTSGLAIASLVLGIIGVFASWFTVMIPSILGLIFGAVALKQCKERNLNGRGLALAGFICSIVVMVICLIMFILALACGAWAYGFLNSFYY